MDGCKEVAEEKPASEVGYALRTPLCVISPRFRGVAQCVWGKATATPDRHQEVTASLMVDSTFGAHTVALVKRNPSH